MRPTRCLGLRDPRPGGPLLRVPVPTMYSILTLFVAVVLFCSGSAAASQPGHPSAPPRGVDAAMDRARALEARPNPDAAAVARAYLQCIALFDGATLAHERAGTWLLHTPQGTPERSRALALLETANQHTAGKDPYYLVALANGLLRLGELGTPAEGGTARALKLLETANKVTRGANPHCLLALARALLASRRYKACARACERARMAAVKGTHRAASMVPILGGRGPSTFFFFFF
jgi:hypothetical protein